MADPVEKETYESPETRQILLCPEAFVLVGQSIQDYRYDDDPLSEP